MLRFGFDGLVRQTKAVEVLGERMTKRNNLFWQKQCIQTWIEFRKSQINDRIFWKKRLIRKLKWLRIRSKWSQGAIAMKIKQFPLIYNLNVFAYRMIMSRRN